MFVYRVVNTINSRVYVGLTVCSLEKRWREHRSAANVGVDKPLYRAMRKHGIANFSIELLYTAKDFDDLRAAELRYIEELKAHVNEGGYNLTDHGARFGAPNAHKGEEQYRAKLTEEMVAFIRDPQHWQTSNADLLELVEKRFAAELSRDTVRDARRGDSWKHLNDKYPPIKVRQGSRQSPRADAQREKQRVLLSVHREEAVKKAADLKRGTRGKNAKLTEETVKEIFYSTESNHALSRKFNISRHVIAGIKNRTQHVYLTKEL